MWKDAAVCELDGPRIMGPITSLKMLVAFTLCSWLNPIMGGQCTATGNRCQVCQDRSDPTSLHKQFGLPDAIALCSELC